MTQQETKYRAGQMILANWPTEGLDRVFATLKERPLGGYVFHVKDIQSPTWLRETAEQLWAFYDSQGWAPPFMAVTEEGGPVQRFRQWFSPPSAMSLGLLNDLDVTRQTGALVGQYLLASGINWNFAPAVDVVTERRSHIIGTRSFSSDPAVVARHAAAWLQGQQGAGVLATAKHYPGHGMTARDSHVERPVVDMTQAQVESHLIPYREAFQAGVAAVMTAHITYPAQDPRPATLSPFWLQAVLRDELKFSGLVVTDALSMKAIAMHLDPVQAAVAAIQAGADVIDCGGSFDQALQMFDAVAEMMGRASGPDSVARLTASSQRIARAKERLVAPPNWPDWPRPEALTAIYRRISGMLALEMPQSSCPEQNVIEVWASGSPPTEVEEDAHPTAGSYWLDTRADHAWTEVLAAVAERSEPVVLYADNLWKHQALVTAIQGKLGPRLWAVVAVVDPVDEELFDVPVCVRTYGNRDIARTLVKQVQNAGA